MTGPDSNKRAAGILLPVFSLPSAHGIGTLGRAAHEFVDFLSSAGQKYWQVLPLNPTGYGNSPYSSCSVFAGNPYFIDLDELIDEGLLKKSEVAARDFGSDPSRIDYGRLYFERGGLLRIAFERDSLDERADYSAFLLENSAWLDDYALFSALRSQFSMRPWTEWRDASARLHRAGGLKKYGELLSSELEFHKYVQYLFYKQWQKLKAHANENGIAIIGDLPIYCALDSADVWANRGLFLLDGNGAPTLVAGVPPDAFTEDGQLWGNPLYDWSRMKQGGFSWWMRRLESAEKLFDAVRIDHFRALESFWAVPASDETARNGFWMPGPGLDFINAIKKHFSNMRFIAEDLGFLTEAVHSLRRASGFPGMKVLEFAFDPSGTSDYLPHNYEKNCVCYTGTHDNAPLAQYVSEATESEKAFIKKYLGVCSARSDAALCKAILRAGLASSANIFIAQLQDYIGLGASSRINAPGTSDNNWTWRLGARTLTAKLANGMRELASLYGR